MSSFTERSWEGLKRLARFLKGEEGPWEGQAHTPLLFVVAAEGATPRDPLEEDRYKGEPSGRWR